MPYNSAADSFLTKQRSGLPISDNWTFFARFYQWRAKTEYRLEIAVYEVMGHFGPKFQIEGDIPHEPFVHGYIGQ